MATEKDLEDALLRVLDTYEKISEAAKFKIEKIVSAALDCRQSIEVYKRVLEKWDSSEGLNSGRALIQSIINDLIQTEAGK